MHVFALLEIAATASGFEIETATADFSHLDGDPFAYLRAFVYATGALVHKGISEEGNQPLKIPNSYFDNILERFEMEDANAAHTPGYGPELSAEQPEDKLLEAEATKLYQAITGSLLYLVHCTRYDLCYEVNQLTRACGKPAEIHMTAAKHALRYLRGTTNLPIVYKRGQFRMVSYTDASFGANPDNCKSTTGYLFYLGGGLSASDPSRSHSLHSRLWRASFRNLTTGQGRRYTFPTFSWNWDSRLSHRSPSTAIAQEH